MNNLGLSLRAVPNTYRARTIKRVEGMVIALRKSAVIKAIIASAAQGPPPGEVGNTSMPGGALALYLVAKAKM